MSKSNSSLLLLFFCIVCLRNGKGNSNQNIPDVVADSRVYIAYLGERRHNNPELMTNSHHDLLATIVGSKELASEMMIYSNRHGFSGFAAKLTESQARKLSEFPGVVQVVPNSLHKLQTTRSWDFLGLPYDSPSNILHRSNMGDGVITGMVDIGIWPESGSFTEKGVGPIPPNWKGYCETGDKFNASIHCNRKIIGACWFISGILAEYGKSFNTYEEVLSPRDADGHGTHTPRKLADPFDYGGGIVNPNGAADPGLVFDMDTADYIQYLCSTAYDTSAISWVSGRNTTCPTKKTSVMDINMPSITVPSLRNRITVKRTVTNVGAPQSIYNPPFGTTVSVKPKTLVFNSTVQKLFQV